MNTKKQTQKETIKKWLNQGRKITSMQAFEKFKITRLSAVIFDLRAEGMIIESPLVRKNGAAFAEYKKVA